MAQKNNYEKRNSLLNIFPKAQYVKEGTGILVQKMIVPRYIVSIAIADIDEGTETKKGHRYTIRLSVQNTSVWFTAYYNDRDNRDKDAKMIQQIYNTHKPANTVVKEKITPAYSNVTDPIKDFMQLIKRKRK